MIKRFEIIEAIDIFHKVQKIRITVDIEIIKMLERV